MELCDLNATLKNLTFGIKYCYTVYTVTQMQYFVNIRLQLTEQVYCEC